MKKVYLSPSNAYANRFFDGEHNEQEVCEELAELLSGVLLDCGFAVYGWRERVSQRIEQANREGADAYIALCTGIGGCGPLIQTVRGGPLSRCLAEQVYDRLAAAYPGRGRGIRDSAMAELSGPLCPAIRVELASRRDPADGAWVLANLPVVARAIAAGVCAYFGVPYRPGEADPQDRKACKSTYTAPPEDAGRACYRVYRQAGVFDDIKLAAGFAAAQDGRTMILYQ